MASENPRLTVTSLNSVVEQLQQQLAALQTKHTEDTEQFQRELQAQREATTAAAKRAEEAASALAQSQVSASNGSDASEVATPAYEPRLKTKEPPLFNPSVKETSVRSWVFTVNNYFKAVGAKVRDEQKINFAVTLLAGPALQWWRQLLQSQQQGGSTLSTSGSASVGIGSAISGQTAPACAIPTTWEEFCNALTTRFEVLNPTETARNRLRHLRQLASVQDYTSRFLAISSEIDNLQEPERCEKYFTGLKPELQREIAKMGISNDFNLMTATAERLDALDYQFRNSQPRRRTEINGIENDNRGMQNGRGGERPKFKCYNCGIRGHLARDCRKSKRRQSDGTERQSGNDNRQ